MRGTLYSFAESICSCILLLTYFKNQMFHVYFGVSWAATENTDGDVHPVDQTVLTGFVCTSGLRLGSLPIRGMVNFGPWHHRSAQLRPSGAVRLSRIP